MSAHTPEHYGQAASFYDGSPTGQYDDEAAHALRCHFDLLEALRDMVSDRDCLSEATVKFAKAAIAKATGGAA